MTTQQWLACVAAISVSGILLLAITACQGPADTPASPTVPDASMAASDQETAGSPGTSPAQTPNSPQAAQAYATCLTDAGVPVMIVEGNRVVLAAATDQPGGASAANSIQAQQRCLQKVPAYHEPDYNQR